MTLYNLKSALDDFRITKFDRDLNPESSYLLGPDDRGTIQCECPAGVRPSCRHRQMLPHLRPLVDTEWFWDFERSVTCDSNGKVLDPYDLEVKLTFEDTPRAALDIISDPANWETMSEAALSPNPILDDIPLVEVPSPAKSNGWRRI
jgi:hypothetical protein